jgi:hypothetical protein
MALLQHFARLVAAQLCGRGLPLFAADGVLAESQLPVLADAALRRAERDRSTVALALVPSRTRLAAVERVAVAVHGDGWAVLVGDAHSVDAEERLDRVLPGIERGVAVYRPEPGRILSAQELIGAVVTARTAGRVRL